MALVDTTVWIDFFSGRNEPHVATLQELIESEEDLSLCGVILAEVLQGIRNDKDFIKTKESIQTSSGRKIEVFKVVLRESSESDALQAVAAMQKGKVIDLTANIAMTANKGEVFH